MINKKLKAKKIKDDEYGVVFTKDEILVLTSILESYISISECCSSEERCPLVMLAEHHVYNVAKDLNVRFNTLINPPL